MSTRQSFFELYEKKKRPLILDGAIGSLLQSKLKSKHTSLWSSELNVTNSQEITELHRSYIDAGADIITTNTFRTNPYAVKTSRKNYEIKKLVEDSVSIAISARDSRDILIAGSNAPAEDCYQKERNVSLSELKENHEQHIETLWNGGVDLILNETMSHKDEIEIVSKYCNERSIPYITSLYLTDDLQLLSGESFYEIITFVTEYSPIAIGVNCISPSLFNRIELDRLVSLNFGFYLNCGSGNVNDRDITCGISADDYLDEVKSHLKYDPVFVGSCCGSNPDHTRAIKEYFDEFYSD